MAKIKTESMPYYDKSGAIYFIDQAILKEQHTAFGLYLYYTYRFQNQTFNTVDGYSISHLQDVQMSGPQNGVPILVLPILWSASGEYRYRKQSPLLKESMPMASKFL